MNEISKKYILFEIDRSVNLPFDKWIPEEGTIQKITYTNDERTTAFSYGFGAWGYFSYGSSGSGTLPAYLEGRKPILKVNSLQSNLGYFLQAFSLEDLKTATNTFFFDIDEQILYVNFPNTNPRDYDYLILGATKGYANIEGYYGNIFYEGRIKTAPNISISKDNQYFGTVTYDTGSVTLNNTDGIFDNFRDEDIYGAVVKVLTSTSTNYIDFKTIYSGYLDSFSLSTRTLNINMRDIRATLQSNISTSLWDKTTYPNIKDDLVDKVIPLAWGKVLDTTAFSLNETEGLSTYTFKLTSHAITSIQQVYVEGVRVNHSSTNLTQATFVLSSSVYKPGQKVTVDFTGSPITNPLSIIEEICELSGIPYNIFYFDTIEWEAIRNSGLPECNLYISTLTQAIQAINLLSNSIFGLFLLTQDGRFTYKVKNTSAPIKKTILVSELLTPPTLDYLSDNYVSSVNVGYARKYTERDSYSYFKNSTLEDSLREKYRVSKTKQFQTQLTNRNDAETYSQTVLNEFGGIFPEYTFDTKMYLSDIEILDILEVELYRFDDKSYGKVKVIVNSISYDYNTNRIQFKCRWLEDVTAHIDLAAFIKWTPATSYLQGAVVQSDGQLWRAIVPSIDNKPMPDSAFWNEFGMLFWQEYVLYPINAIVNYQGVLYKALQSSLNEIPNTSPLYWELVSAGGSVEWNNVLSYKTGNIVYYNTTWWQSKVDSNKGNTPIEGVNWTKITNFSVNAATATVLQTARTIGGVSFNGSANIDLPGVNTTGNQDTTGNAATATTAASCSGNALTATTLQNARTIGGVLFNGSANIDLPGVNTTGNQNTTGSAATLTTARTIGGVSFNGSANINLPGVNTTGNQNTTGNAATATNATQAINAFNATEWDGAAKTISAIDPSGGADGDIWIKTVAGGGGSVTSVAAGDGLNFTTITSSGSVTLGTPSTVNGSSTNSVTTTSHTHALGGIIDFALTGYAAASGTITASDSIKTAIQKLGFDKHVAVTLQTNHGLNLSTQALALGTPSAITGTSTNSVTTTTHTHALTTGYGDGINPYASKTAKHFLAAPNGSNGVPTFRAIVASDLPTLDYYTKTEIQNFIRQTMINTAKSFGRSTSSSLPIPGEFINPTTGDLITY